MLDRKSAWVVKQAGSVWKVYYHGAWARTFNTKAQADDFVAQREAVDA